MFNFSSVLLMSTLLISGHALAASTPDKQAVTTMIANADQYRIQPGASKVISFVSLYKHDELDSTRQYNVYTRPNRESLVVFKSPVEAGQKMLMKEDNYWLLMPKSRRPIRITPMQKLLGEASVGDISTLTWSEDYQGEWVNAEQIETGSGQEVSAHQLKLTAITKGASYQVITLWLSAESDFPIKADLYLRSGKMAKQAWFKKGLRDGLTSVVAMTLLDKIQPSKKTVIEYQDISVQSLDDKYYNPAYLSRNSVSDL
ncbi:outer membrane lipoprotein-sorting protein [Vibrio genomosp. F6]|uniref:outer membrane lipoprotein-sorting protein n=1 Tax=Vibrio genomosp. F6 TaxID=723172 RepID=UPI0010BD4DDB|nr:outer membrane lipoprotein-sorting protein [Vibrio genomosp. F6]TKF21567.1 outer membrane lipoprotein-sorting protein [Vibrio genomosp. F6]